MRTTILATLVSLLTCACSSMGGATVSPLRAVGSASGDATGPQAFFGTTPLNALVRVHGQVSYTIQPFPPYVTLDGSYDILVEPLPGREVEAQTAVARGDMLIRRAGVPGALNAPGSIAGYKAALMRYWSPPSSRPEKTVAACEGPDCEVPHP